ncbi:IS3 family transposase [Streptomyces sp. NPDC101455]|uniref:IS3 family transposase n=1 Tax=Streptomyces sp. NPDC101455 TaxID=3366142 RepID=UPI00381E7FB1
MFRIPPHHRQAPRQERLCRVGAAPRSGYYRWRAVGARAGRALSDAELTGKIREIHTGWDGTYGSPRITAEPRAEGRRVNHKRVERVMREAGIVGVHPRKKVTTTVPAPDAAQAPDLLQRDVTASEPNTKNADDITYLPMDDGQFPYVATVLDLSSKRLAGWAIADHMRTELVTDALAAAARTRGGDLAGAVFHSDNGNGRPCKAANAGQECVRFASRWQLSHST